MSLLILVPLIFSLLIAVATAMQVIKRKSLAQSHCIREAVETQNRLRVLLIQILKLNPKARILRARRAAADRAVRIAMAAKHPAAIALAKANQAAVILEQLALKAQQNQILIEARLKRTEALRRLNSRLTNAGTARSTPLFPRALAVVPVPANSLSPDYRQAPRFSYFQQQNFNFKAELYPDSEWRQETACAASLSPEEDKWKIRILAANASSNWF